ncbi:hypothetical protein [Brevibacillus formosus]|uniref:hypothetical protein n=1 Tax=Brevibacillus formosus TaxID=54913 RepID=UPI002155EB7A|nr:hypothetical protein [Brevibacillus formosus]
MMIRNYEQKCKAIERAIGALQIEGREIIEKCFFEQKRDKGINELDLRIPKSSYDFHKNQAIDTVTFILKAAAVI